MLVLVLLAIEIQSYRRGRTIISRRRMTLRMVAGALLLTLLVAVFLGLFVLGLRDASTNPQFFLAYWSMCLLAAIALMRVMLADLQEVEDRLTQRQHEMWRDMARFVGEQISGRKRADAGGKSEKPE
jgi:Na+/melibiose symporter-like transporter